MQRLCLLGLLSVTAVFSVATTSEANGGLFRRRGGCCDAVVIDCAIAPCAPVMPPAPEYVEMKVTRYRQVMVEKDVEYVVRKCVPRQEKFTYDVQVCTVVPEKRSVTENRLVYEDVDYKYSVFVPVTVQEKRKLTVYETVNEVQEYTYTVCVPVTTAEKRTETYYNAVTKDVEYKYTVSVPKTMQKVVKQTTYNCVTENVTEMVNLCRTVRVSYVDECGRCYVRCERVMVQEPVTRCIVRHVPVTTDVTVNYTVCELQERVGKRTVCELVPATRDVTVNVTRYENQARTGKRTICRVVPVEREVTVNVTRCNTEERVGKKSICKVVPETREITVNVAKYVTEKREGSRTVYDVVDEKVKRKVQVCTTEAYEEVVRVQVGCPTTDCCSSPARLGGLFGRLRCR